MTEEKEEYSFLDISDGAGERIAKRLKQDRIRGMITTAIIVIICLAILGVPIGFAIYCTQVEKNAVLYVAYTEGFDLSKLDYTATVERSKKGVYVVEIIMFPSRETLQKYAIDDIVGALHCIVTYKGGEYDYFVVDHEGW